MRVVRERKRGYKRERKGKGWKKGLLGKGIWEGALGRKESATLYYSDISAAVQCVMKNLSHLVGSPGHTYTRGREQREDGREGWREGEKTGLR